MRGHKYVVGMMGKIWGYLSDYLFWVFVAVMIILGTAVETPLINVGLTAR